jgi:spermidine/putrescine transport system ATP-binding protein
LGSFANCTRPPAPLPSRTTRHRRPRGEIAITTTQSSQAEPDIRLEGVVKRFGDHLAVAGLDLEIERGAFYALLGPSGCGKTTTLRMIGGFEEPSAGRVFLGGADVTDMPPYKRDVNTVFQSYALFPHLDVQKNVAFGLERRKLGRAEIRERVAEALELTQLTGFEKRRPTQLSGGQQQRVALARALVNRPRALLLDEPLGALDLRLRKQLQVELKRIQQEVGITFIHVTHDQEEAMALADTIAVMNHGLIEQAGSATELYERPVTEFVANFLGVSNLIPGTLCHRNGTRAEFKTQDGSRVVLPVDRLNGETVGASMMCGVRPEKVRLLPASAGEPTDGANVLQGKVELASFLGVSIQYVIRTPSGEELTVFQQNTGSEPESIGPGRDVLVTWQPEHTFVVNKETVNA